MVHQEKGSKMTRETKRINLALQGGGSHGAFAWGVLNRILEDDHLIIDAISGTSVGSVNAAVLIDGYMKDGKPGAIKALENFWRQIATREAFSPFRRTPIEKKHQGWNLDHSLGYQVIENMLNLFSPYALNPLNYNPLHDLLAETLSIVDLQACSIIKLFVTATRVHNGHARVFKCEEITVDVLMASACLPQIFQAVEIDGEPYWDGGYVGNPSLWPLIYKAKTPDILLVQLNPVWRKETPKTVIEIDNRLNEISFNASLIAELRAISFVSKLLKEGRLDLEHYKDIHFHMIDKPDELLKLNASSKFNCEWEFLCYLRDLGYQTTETWLKENFHKIGKESSVSIHETFLEK
jgi:NTE family protein